MLSPITSISIKRYHWEIIRKFVENFQEIEIISKQWGDKNKQSEPDYYPLDLSKIETWRTCDENIYLVFSVENNRLICNVKLYQDGRFNTYLSCVKFTAKLGLPDSFIREIEDNIINSFDRFMENEYDIFLEKQKNKWKGKFKYKFLNDK